MRILVERNEHYTVIYLNKVKTKIIILFCLILFAVEANAGDNVFFISRSLNGNVVNYDIQLTGGKLNTNEPLRVYWNNIADNPVNTKELSLIQRKLAYGYSTESATPTEAVVKLKAYKHRSLHICKHKGKWVAMVTINGKKCILNEIYAHSPSRTSCDYIILKGKTVDGGIDENETVKP